MVSKTKKTKNVERKKKPVKDKKKKDYDFDLTRYSLLWIIYYLVSGFITYLVFKKDILLLLLTILIFEVAYFGYYRHSYNFIRRFFINIFYLVGYLVPVFLF